jgi:hypothetical protein
VIFFALLGLLFDSISLLTFKYCAGKEGGDNGSSRTLELMMMQQQQQQQQGGEEEEWSVTNDEGGDDEEREEGGSLPTLAEFSLTSSSSLSTSSSSSSSSVTKKKDMDFDQISLEPNHHNHQQGVDPTDLNMLSALLHGWWSSHVCVFIFIFFSNKWTYPMYSTLWFDLSIVSCLRLKLCFLIYGWRKLSKLMILRFNCPPSSSSSSSSFDFLFDEYSGF